MTLFYVDQDKGDIRPINNDLHINPSEHSHDEENLLLMIYMVHYLFLVKVIYDTNVLHYVSLVLIHDRTKSKTIFGKERIRFYLLNAQL